MTRKIKVKLPKSPAGPDASVTWLAFVRPQGYDDSVVQVHTPSRRTPGSPASVKAQWAGPGG